MCECVCLCVFFSAWEVVIKVFCVRKDHQEVVHAFFFFVNICSYESMKDK